MGKGTDPMDETAVIKITPPYEVRLSPKVVARYGYKDGHVELEVEVRLPGPFSKIAKPFTYKQSFSADELRRLKNEAVDKAVQWSELPDFQRQRDGAP